MNKKCFPIIVMFVLLAGAASGQSKKTIKEKGIASITVQEYFIEEGL